MKIERVVFIKIRSLVLSIFFVFIFAGVTNAFIYISAYPETTTFQKYAAYSGVTEKLAVDVPGQTEVQGANNLQHSLATDEKQLYYLKAVATDSIPLSGSFRVYLYDGKYFRKATVDARLAPRGYMAVDQADYNVATNKPIAKIIAPLPNAFSQFSGFKTFVSSTPGMEARPFGGYVWAGWTWTGYKTDNIFYDKTHNDWVDMQKTGKYVLNFWSDTGEGCYLSFNKGENGAITMTSERLDNKYLREVGFSGNDLNPCVIKACSPSSQSAGTALQFEEARITTKSESCKSPQYLKARRELGKELEKKTSQNIEIGNSIFSFETIKGKVSLTERSLESVESMGRKIDHNEAKVHLMCLLDQSKTASECEKTTPTPTPKTRGSR